MWRPVVWLGVVLGVAGSSGRGVLRWRIGASRWVGIVVVVWSLSYTVRNVAVAA